MYKFILFILVLLNSQLFFTVHINPYGVLYLHEVFLAFLVIYSIVYLVRSLSSSLRVNSLDAAIFTLVFLSFILSGLLANFKYGQPIYYGIMEARRTLSLLIYFPIVSLLRRSKINHIDIIKSIILVALIATLLNFLTYFDVIPSLSAKIKITTGIRENRFTSAGYHMMLAIAAIFALGGEKGWKPHRIAIAIVFMFNLLLIIQSRQLIIGTITILIFSVSLRFRKFFVFFLSAMLSFLMFSSTQLGQEYISRYSSLFNSIQFSTSNVRYDTLQYMYYDVLKTGYLGGHGALSLQWRGGFHGAFYSHFYLVDVGWFGTVFRYGIFSILVLGLFVWINWKTLVYCKSNAMIYNFVLWGLVAMWVLFPLASPTDYYGFYVGVLLAVGGQGTLKNTYYVVTEGHFPVFQTR